MEGGTDSHVPRKLKEHSNRVDDLGDLKVPHEPESHFGTFSPSWQIAGEEPVLLAHPIARGWGATIIGRFLVSNVGAQEGHSGFPPRKVIKDHSIGLRDRDLLCQHWLKWRLVSGQWQRSIRTTHQAISQVCGLL